VSAQPVSKKQRARNERNQALLYLSGGRFISEPDQFTFFQLANDQFLELGYREIQITLGQKRPHFSRENLKTKGFNTHRKNTAKG
jgi:hypothetical protein